MPPPEKVAYGLELLTNDDVGDESYNTWIDIGHEIKSWNDTDEVGWRLWDDWGATWPGRDGKSYDRKFARERWVSFHPTQTNIGAFFNRVTARVGPGWWEKASSAKAEAKPAATEKTELGLSQATPYSFPDPNTIRNGIGCTGVTCCARQSQVRRPLVAPARVHSRLLKH